MSQYKKQHFNEDCLKKIRVSRDHQLTKHCQLTKKMFNIISAECSTKVVQRLNRSHVNTQHFNSYSSSRTNTKKKMHFCTFFVLVPNRPEQGKCCFVCVYAVGRSFTYWSLSPTLFSHGHRFADLLSHNSFFPSLLPWPLSTNTPHQSSLCFHRPPLPHLY